VVTFWHAVSDDGDEYASTGEIAAMLLQLHRLTAPDDLIHGDAGVGNVLHDYRGNPMVIDLDGFAVGPREWDLALTAIYYDSFGWHTREEYEDFVRVYGPCQEPVAPSMLAAAGRRGRCAGRTPRSYGCRPSAATSCGPRG
jgi:aminoglycoside phosphotransferase (APT) family kinase protein